MGQEVHRLTVSPLGLLGLPETIPVVYAADKGHSFSSSLPLLLLSSPHGRKQSAAVDIHLVEVAQAALGNS